MSFGWCSPSDRGSLHGRVCLELTRLRGCTFVTCGVQFASEISEKGLLTVVLVMKFYGSWAATDSHGFEYLRDIFTKVRAA